MAPAGGVRASMHTICGLLCSVLDGTARGLSALEPIVEFTPRVRIGAAWITLEHQGRKITWHNGSTGGSAVGLGLTGTPALELRCSRQFTVPLTDKGFRL